MKKLSQMRPLLSNSTLRRLVKKSFKSLSIIRMTSQKEIQIIEHGLGKPEK